MTIISDLKIESERLNKKPYYIDLEASYNKKTNFTKPVLNDDPYKKKLSKIVNQLNPRVKQAIGIPKTLVVTHLIDKMKGELTLKQVQDITQDLKNRQEQSRINREDLLERQKIYQNLKKKMKKEKIENSKKESSDEENLKRESSDEENLKRESSDEENSKRESLKEESSEVESLMMESSDTENSDTESSEEEDPEEEINFLRTKVKHQNKREGLREGLKRMFLDSDTESDMNQSDMDQSDMKQSDWEQSDWEQSDSEND